MRKLEKRIIHLPLKVGEGYDLDYFSDYFPGFTKELIKSSMKNLSDLGFFYYDKKKGNYHYFTDNSTKALELKSIKRDVSKLTIEGFCKYLSNNNLD